MDRQAAKGRVVLEARALTLVFAGRGIDTTGSTRVV